MDRLIVPDVELRLDVGETLEVIRGDGLGEGDRIGEATVVGFDRGGSRSWMCTWRWS